MTRTSRLPVVSRVVGRYCARRGASRPMTHRFAVFVLFVLALTSAAPAQMAGASVAHDISYPQCGHRLPKRAHAAFAVIGANNGRTFTTNPCLVRQLHWAKTLRGAPAFYANTG